MKLTNTDVDCSRHCKCMYSIPIIFRFTPASYYNLCGIYDITITALINLQYTNDIYIISSNVPRVKLINIQEFLHNFFTANIP